jgi:hypothetical protein
MEAKLDEVEKRVIFAALVVMVSEASPADREEAHAITGSIVRKLDLRAAAEGILSEAARQSTPRTRGEAD